MEEVRTILCSALVAFQLCLGLWQIGKLTPLGGLVQAGMAWLLSLLPFRSLSSNYALLQRFPGRVFKRVIACVVTKAGASQDELFAVSADRPDLESCEMISLSYLGDEYKLERKDGNKLYIQDKMSYYVTDAIWKNLLFMGQLNQRNALVYSKGYKEFWRSTVTGDVMTLPEVLSCVILDNSTFLLSDNEWLLPVNLSLSEEKVLKILNLVGLFLQTKKVFWWIPTMLSFASAMLEFNTKLRSWLYTNINKVFCWSMHFICDKFSYSKRMQVYSLGKWVENLKPCNDLQLKVVKGDISAVVAGGAKTDKEHATLIDWLNVEQGQTQISFYCDPDPVVIECVFAENRNVCDVRYASGLVAVECKSREEYVKICTLVSCVAKNRSGSLISCDDKNKVHVRGWKESVRHYVKTGLPPIYELKLEHVIVNSI